MDDRMLREKLASGRLTQNDVLAILDWQLSLPAEQMDTNLIAECDLYLAPDAPGLGKAREDAMLDSLFEAIDAREGAKPRARRAKSPARGAHRRPIKRALIVVLALLALLALTVGGVAYGYRRGVLNFTEDFGFARMVSQQGAEEFVSSSLAHVELEHVTIDVLEAVYDGADLRVVYGLTSADGEVHMAENAVDSFIMPGQPEGEVHMCDYIIVNGQDAYFYDAWEAAGAPGQVLYYLQTSLPAWGVDVTGAQELTIGLPMFPRKDPESREPSPTLDFTIPATVPEGLVRSARIVEADMDGHEVTIEKAIFSPLNGYIQLRIAGLSLGDYRRNFTGWCEVYAMDDSRLTSSHPEGPDMADGDDVIVDFTITPPEGEWPDRFVIALELEDYSPDWEAVIELEPAR